MRNNCCMRGQLGIMAGGATIVVGALALVATSAYASPVPTSSRAVAHSPSLVVPTNYHPAAFAGSVSPSSDGLVVVAPVSAAKVPEAGARTSSVTVLAPQPDPAGKSKPAPGGAPGPASKAGPPPKPTPASPPGPSSKPGPPSKPTPAPAVAPASKGDPGHAPAPAVAPAPSAPRAPGSNNGNDLKNKGTGANKGNGDPHGK